MLQRQYSLKMAAIAFGSLVASHLPAHPEGAQPVAAPASPLVRSGELVESGQIKQNPYLDMLRQKARIYGLPPELPDAVMFVESRYDPSAIGSSGEIGLMQVKPATAALLGFRGSALELAVPETNIELGVRYLAKAWQLAGGDLCRTLLKYRAGHGEERETALSVQYCQRARAHLAAVGSPLAIGATATLTPTPPTAYPPPKTLLLSRLKRPRMTSGQFWALHEERVRALRAQVHLKWARLARVAARH